MIDVIRFSYPTRCGRVRNDTCQSKKAERIESMIKPMAWNDFDTFSPKYLEVSNNLPIFAVSKIIFDYAAECGEQAFIDTTPFKSHIIVAFIFHIFYEIFY